MVVNPIHADELSVVCESGDDKHDQSSVGRETSRWKLGGEISTEEGDLDTDNEELVIDNEMSCQDGKTFGEGDDEEDDQNKDQVDSRAMLELGVLDNSIHTRRQLG